MSSMDGESSENVIFKEEQIDGRARVTADEKQVARCETFEGFRSSKQ